MTLRKITAIVLCCIGCAEAVETPIDAAEAARYQADLARVHENYRHWTEAAQAFETALTASPDEDLRWQCREGLARVKTRLGDVQAGLAFASDCARSDDPVRQATGEMILAEHFTTTGQPELAAERYERIIRRIGIAAYQEAATTPLAALPRTAVAPVLARAWGTLASEPTDAGALRIVRACEPDPARRAAALRPLIVAQPGHLDLVAECVGWHLANQAYADAGALLAAVQAQYTPADLAPLQARIAAAQGDLAGAETAIARGLAGIEDPFQRHLAAARGLGEVGAWAAAATRARNALALAADPARKAAAEIELAEALVRQQLRAEAQALLAPLAAQDAWPGIADRAKNLLALPVLPVLPSPVSATPTP